MDQKGQRLPFFSKDEVAQHDLLNDCWVSKFGRVYDLTPLVKENEGVLVQPILKFAGQDITHWFDPDTKQPKTHIDPVLNVRLPFCPHGRYLHIPPADPTSDFNMDIETPWWDDESYLKGLLSRRQRKLRLVNNLSGQDDVIEVCDEEIMEEIRSRYLRYNAHAASYTWKRLGNPLDMTKTLEENGMPDESEEFTELGIDEDEFIPTIHLSFNDDLTVA